MENTSRPLLRMLSDSMVSSIYNEALKVVEEIGIFVENEEALKLLDGAGMKIDKETKRVSMTGDLVKKSLESAPHKFHLYDVDGNMRVTMEGNNVHYDPGSAALNILDGATNESP
jgi:trimethylamine--corrinoid protein Co-methyltransferase